MKKEIEKRVIYLEAKVQARSPRGSSPDLAGLHEAINDANVEGPGVCEESKAIGAATKASPGNLKEFFSKSQGKADQHLGSRYMYIADKRNSPEIYDRKVAPARYNPDVKASEDEIVGKLNDLLSKHTDEGLGSSEMQEIDKLLKNSRG